MAKSSGGVQTLLVEKGEKIGLGIAAGLGGLLLVLGMLSVFSRSQDPEAFAKKLDDKSGGLKGQINSSTAEIEPAAGPVWDNQGANNQLLALVPTRGTLFDPTDIPDGKRIAPIVLAPIEGQVDIAVVKLAAHDIRLIYEDGKVVGVSLGVIETKDKAVKTEGVGNFMNVTLGKFKARKAQPTNQQGGFPGGGGMGGGFPGGGGMGGGFPGGGGMGGGFPGGGGMGGGFPGGGGMGGGFSGSKGGNLGTGFGGGGLSGTRSETTVQRVEGANEEEIDKKMKGRSLALTIRPERMAIIQAALPYRAQLERYRVALRYKDIKELYAHPEDMPVYNGVEVQRRMYNAKGELLEDWSKLDYVNSEAAQNLRAVKLDIDREELADLLRVMLHEDHQLVMPLPIEVTGKYPEMRMKEVKDAIEKLKKLNATVNVPAPKNRFAGDNKNPFGRANGDTVKSGVYNGLGGGGGDEAMGGGGGFKLNFPKQKGGDNVNQINPNAPVEPPDVAYVRIFDTDIEDGFTYQYRLRARLLNPNYERADDVSKKSDAENKELPLGEEHWFEIGQKVKVPNAEYMYVVDPAAPLTSDELKKLTPEDKKKRERAAFPMPTPKEGQAIIQVQRWYKELYLTANLTEPVGDWILADLIATRGMYVSGKAFAPLPLWSSTQNAFQLRDVFDERPPTGKDARRGVVLEPIRPRTVLAVEVTGGKTRARIPSNPGDKSSVRNTVDDESAAEVLFMYPDGSMEVKTSARDKADTDRRAREDIWKKWIADTEAGAAPKAGTGTGKVPNEF